jgi:hypothetical protein
MTQLYAPIVCSELSYCKNRAFIGMDANNEPPRTGLRRPYFYSISANTPIFSKLFIGQQ